MKDNNSNNTELQTDNPITEKFHVLLAANTKKLNDLRLEYAQRMAKAQDKYDKAMAGWLSLEHFEKRELDKARKAYEEAKEKYEIYISALQNDRHKSGRIYAAAKADAKNYWATENEKIQIERHNIFERFRDSRDVFTDDEAVKGLLHPGWTKEDKKGGDDGDKEE
ncbi:hypothetical protein [Phascolarctobacterium succinatutens]|uniref:hypothetical protein n=1 Tax=Phascolarctobacterium succinatutens TaxID=626940 RepID=UPI0026F21E4B|nr:hypothetical protein [Phascolarctobacterium succinatutens]